MMFIIKKISDNSLHRWDNKRTDDFIKYLPTNLQTTLEDLEVYLLPDSCENLVNEGRVLIINNEGGTPSLDVYTGVDIIDEEAGTYNLTGFIKNCPSQLLGYPYDEDGNFVEPEEFIP